jgi:hypothetical protein
VRGSHSTQAAPIFESGSELLESRPSSVRCPVRTRSPDRARSRRVPTARHRARSASASLSEIEIGESDQSGDKQEDRVHCSLLQESSSRLLIVEWEWPKSTIQR